MNINFQIVNWNLIETIKHPGEAGEAFWKTIHFEGLRIRIVEYSKGYLADHWWKKGMSYVVSDDLSSHRSFSEYGVTLLVIDGDFLGVNQLATAV